MRKQIVFFIVLLASLPAQAALQIQSWSQPDGAKVLFVESRSVPILDISIQFDAGARRDPEGKAGLAAMTNALLSTGVRAGLQKGPQDADEPALSEAQISDALADIGAQRFDEAGTDRAGMSLRTLASSTEREAALALLARVIAQPAFPPDLFARDKARAIAAIKEDLTKPEAILGRAAQRLMYGSHPYAREDTVESVGSITRDDLLFFHGTHYVANRAIIAIIGDIARSDAERIARQMTQRLPQGAPLEALPPVSLPAARQDYIEHPASQSQIVIGTPGEARGDPDYFALMVGNYVLGGGGFVSRLMQEVREKRGLVYGVDSHFQPLAQPGPFEISLQTRKEQTEPALALVRQTLAAFLRDGPTDKEIAAAKNNLIGGFGLRIDNNRKILDNISNIGFYNLPLDYLDTWTAKVAAVRQNEIKAAFQRKVIPAHLITVVVGAGAPATPPAK